MPELRIVVADEARAALEHLAQALGITLEALLKRSLAAYLPQVKVELTFEPIGFGMWADRPEMQDAAQWVANLRGERGTPTSELEAFQAVCQRLGLRYTLEPHAADASFLDDFVPAVSQQAQWCLSCGQNYLYFDRQGRFLGTLGDENGAWEPRTSDVPSPKEAST